MAVVTGTGAGETLFGTPAADQISGLAGNDTLMALAGADLLSGGLGNDALAGGDGGDTIDGGAGIDNVAYFLDGGPQGVLVNLNTGTAVDGFGSIDHLISIEQVYGSTFNDTLIGSAALDDLLVGRGGADLLQGLAGADVLVGDQGADTLDGGAGMDRVAYYLETGTLGVRVNLGAGTAVDTHGTIDVLTSIEQVYGSDLADTLTGSATGDLFFGRDGADLLQGLSGDDTLVGGAGVDVLNGGAGADLVSYALETGTRGVVVDMRAGTATDTYGTTDSLLSIEAVQGTDLGDTILGSDVDGDRLFGGDGDDFIDGRDGNNLIYTGAGNDHIVVGTTLAGARDTVVVNGHGVKVVTGTGATGTPYAHHLVFYMDEAVTVNLATGIAQSANMTLDFTAARHFLEVVGSAFDDHLIGGNPLHDDLEWLSGNQGNDTIDGGSGTGNTVNYDDEVRYGTVNPVTGEQQTGTRGVVVNLTTGVATDSFGFTDTLIRIDSVRATNFVDVLTGNAAVNGFWGMQGADTMNGGAGSDRVHYGEDALTGGTAGVLVDLAAGYAIDGFGDRDTLISIEEAYGSDVGDTLLGDAADNRLYGLAGNDILTDGFGRDTLNGGSGNDALNSGAGDDELWGGAGIDTLNGGAGTDVARYQDALRGISADLAQGRVADGQGSIDILTSIEGIYGSDFGDTIQGAAAADSLWGAGGNDVIYGSFGADTLLGGAGNDSLLGGTEADEMWGEAGNDTLNGGAGLDLVRYRNATAAVSINLVTGIGRDGQGGTDVLIGVENIDGSDFGDAIIGDVQANRLFGFAGADMLSGGDANDTLLGGDGHDAVSGGAGDDELWGNAGNDTLNGGAGSDLVRYRTVGGAVRVDLAAGTAIDGEGGTDTLLNVEHIDGSDQADVILGDLAANRLFGFAGSDRIDGRGGNDTLLGGAGDDVIIGGTGDNEIWGEAGNDTLDGGAGADLARYRTATGPVTVNLAAGFASEAGGDSDLLISIEHVDGSDQSDALTGSAAANRLFGYAGNDVLLGGTGEDVLVGGLGGDTYHYRAGDGYDIVNDLGASTGGADRVLIHDYLPSQARVYISPPGGTNVVLDFGITRDAVVLVNTLDANHPGAIEFVQFDDGTVWDHATLIARIGGTAVPAPTQGTAGDDVLFGTPADNVIAAVGGNDVIHGMAGNDTLAGGDGNDTIRAGDGNDSVDGGAGDDLLILGAGADTVTGGAGWDTAVFDSTFAGLAGNYAVNTAGIATVAGNVLSQIEVFRFADRDITAVQLAAMARNAAPVSTLPTTLRTPEGNIWLNLARYFTDANGDALTYAVTDLPTTITLTGSVLSGQLQAALTPFTISIIVSDGTNTLRQTLDWQIQNINAAPTGALVLSGTAGTGQLLSVTSTVADADGIDTATLAYSWLRDGTAIAGATAESYTPGAADVGARISVQLRFTDLFGVVETVTSAATLPIIAAAIVRTGTAANDTLRGNVGDDTLSGLDGNDLLEGLDGNDSLDGGNGVDTLIGGAGDDFVFGGTGTGDLRDIIYGGAGNDFIDGGYGNDEIRGDIGNDTIAGGFGSDVVIGGAGDDVVTGSALSDVLYGNDGNDFVNGGFGFDRYSGGTGADTFYHLGVVSHGSDWIQDYTAAEGDVLLFGQAGATRAQFQVNFIETPRAGAVGVAEAFVVYRPTGQIIWALIDGAADSQINLQLGGQVFDLLL